VVCALTVLVVVKHSAAIKSRRIKR